MSNVVRALIKSGASPPEINSREWHSLVADIQAESGRQICGLATRNELKKGWPCEGYIRENARCKMHGGRGGRFKYGHLGRYSKALKDTNLGSDYERARRDPNLLALDEEIAVLAAKLKGTLKKLNRQGDNREIWRVAIKNMRELQRIESVNDDEEASSLVENLIYLFEHGLNDHKVWDEWFSGVATLRKLVDVERKHRVEQGLAMTIEQAMLMMAVWSNAVKNSLPPEYAAKLRAEITRLRNMNAPEHLLPAVSKNEDEWAREVMVIS